MGYTPNGFGEIVLRYGITGEEEDKTIGFGFRSSIGVTSSDLELAANVVGTAWVDNIHTTGDDTLVVPWEFRGWRARWMVGGVEHQAELEAPIVGSTPGDSPVVNTTWLVKKLTGLSGRGNRGRAFIPMFGVVDSAVATDGAVSGTDITNLQTELDAFLTDCETNDAPLVLLHGLVLVDPGPPPVYDPPTAAPVDLTAFTVTSKVATQRRRLR